MRFWRASTDAETAARSDVRQRASGVGDKHPTVGVDTSNRAEYLMDMQRYAEAEPLLLEAERLLIASSGESHPRVVKTRRRLARLYRPLNMPDRAAQYEPS